MRNQLLFICVCFILITLTLFWVTWVTNDLELKHEREEAKLTLALESNKRIVETKSKEIANLKSFIAAQDSYRDYKKAQLKFKATKSRQEALTALTEEADALSVNFSRCRDETKYLNQEADKIMANFNQITDSIPGVNYKIR